MAVLLNDWYRTIDALPGERLVCHCNQSVRSHIALFLLGVLLALIGIMPVLLGETPFPLFIGLAFVGTAYVKSKRHIYAVTDRRIISQIGLISRNYAEIAIAQIQSVEFDQSFIEVVLGVGHIIVRPTGGTPILFYGIRKPKDVVAQINALRGI